MKQKQTLLPLQHETKADFDNFLGEKNQALVHQLKQVACQQEDIAQSANANVNANVNAKVIYLQGEASSGKSFLLHASCAAAHKQNRAQYYFQSLDQNWRQLDFSEDALICIDDVDLLFTQPAALLDLLKVYEYLLPAHGQLIVSSSQALSELPLADLRSRLAIGGQFVIQPLNDEEKQLLLINEARYRGIELDAAVGKYILTHYSRNLAKLMRLLNQIDNISLAEKRRVTIPFIRQLIHS